MQGAHMDLTERVKACQQSGVGRERLHRDLEVMAYEYPRQWHNLTEDDCGEFYLFFRSRIPRLIDRYQDWGKPFEAYIRTCLKWQLRTYLRRKHKDGIHHRLLEDKEFVKGTMIRSVEEGCFTAETAPADLVQSVRGALLRPNGRKEDSMKRRLVILTLKSCMIVRPLHLRAVSVAADVDFDWLLSRWELLCACMERKRARLALLRARRNYSYFRLQYLERRLEKAIEPVERGRLRKEMALQRRRICRTHREIICVPKCPTNAELAVVMGVPKGSVDSSLYYIKRTFPGCADEE